MERSFSYSPPQNSDSDEARLDQLRKEVKNHMMALMIKISGLRQAASTPTSRLINDKEPLEEIRLKLEKLKQEVELWSISCTQLIDRSLEELDRQYTPTFSSQETTPATTSAKVFASLQSNEGKDDPDRH